MTARITEQMLMHLKSGDFQSAANLFIAGQTQGLFPSDSSLTNKLVAEIGKNATEKLISAFSHYPCQFCIKGRTKCKDCKGHGHINHNMVCEQCMGLGSVCCDFCNGSGWMAIEDIPDGLHFAVILTRTQTALSRIKSILEKSLPEISENKPSALLRECAQIIIYFERYIGVLENMIVACSKMTISDDAYKNKINKIHNKCVEAAIKSKQRIRNVFQCMAEFARLEANSSDMESLNRKLAQKRCEFYQGMAKGADVLLDSHSFLEKAIEKYDLSRDHTANKGQQDGQQEQVN